MQGGVPSGPLQRAIARIRSGDLSGADAEVSSGQGSPAPPDQPRWLAMRALLDGRLATCERLIADAAARRKAGAGEPPDASEPSEPSELAADQVTLAALRREQGRPAEAESVLRAAVDAAVAAGAEIPEPVQAFLALLLAEVGRDAAARDEVARLIDAGGGSDLVTAAMCAEAASVCGLFAESYSLRETLRPYRSAVVVEEVGLVCHGSVARHLGRLSHVLGDAEEANRHFRHALAVHTAMGAPLLVAHTSRQLAAVLRVWGDDGDWENSFDLLRQAATVYGRLGVESLAVEAHAVLARSEDIDLALHPSGGQGVFERRGEGWVVGVDGASAVLGDHPGLADIARLLRAPRTALHVADLIAERGAPEPRTRPSPQTWFWPQRPRLVDAAEIGALVDAGAPAAYERRLADLPGLVDAAVAGGDPLGAAVARGEQDVLGAELAALVEPAADPDAGLAPLERAHQIVATRIRLALDRIEEVQPPLGRHLRGALKTGTFCSYEPDREVGWSL